ncbi:MAG: hypothetical protein U0V87_09490 [Acidobacteriota bacterium]
MLRVDDYVSGSVVTHGTGRALWNGTHAALSMRGVSARAAEAASLVRGIDEARASNCTLIVVPEFTEYRASKRELKIGVRIVWFDLEHAERARCEQSRKIAVEKGKDALDSALLRATLDECVGQVYGAAAAKPTNAAPTWIIARYDMIYGTPADPEDSHKPRLGDAASSDSQVLTALESGRSVVVSRRYELGSRLVQRFESYPAGIAVEAEAEIADIEVGARLRTRLEDRAIEALFDVLRNHGTAVPDMAQLGIPASDPLDRIISVIPITLPAIKLSEGHRHDDGTGLPKTWARLDVAANGTVQEAVALDGKPSPALELIKRDGCTPGARAGQPRAMHVIVAIADNDPKPKN